MKKLILTSAIVSSLGFLTSCQQQEADPVAPAAEVEEVTEVPAINHEELYERAVKVLFNSRPTYSTVYGLSEDLLGGKYSDQMPDHSPQNEDRMRRALRGLNKDLQSVKMDDARSDEHRKVMMNLNDYFGGNENFDIGYIDTWMGLSAFIVNQINGPLIDVPNNIVTNHKINTIDDARNYLTRLKNYHVFADSVIEKMDADNSKGWIPPRVIVEKTIKSMSGYIQPKVEDHPLVTNFHKQIIEFDHTTENDTNELMSQVKTHVAESVYPSYEKVIARLEALKDKATTESGIWAQPNGEAFYADAVKKLGDTDLSAAEVHQIGLDEVARIHAEMDAILKANGHTEGSVGERMLAINDDPQFLYEDSDEGRAQLLEDLNGYIEEINQRMPEQFATAPPYDVEVRKFPKSREESAPGGMYSAPTLDGSQPGIYWINLRDIKANPKFDLKTLTYHEANPGHHWQVALNLAQDDMPMLRRLASYNAYAEGWALYSELVAKEMGLYENDPYSDLGRLKAELFRAVRLVVDTGLHYKKWSREEAIKYMAETAGVVESDCVAEIERYMVWPGQALGYKLGMINIVNQRDKARKALGEDFDIKEFHDLILLGGSVPMPILNEKIDAWIASKS